MKAKSIITGVLLAFVAVSIGYLIIKEQRAADPIAQEEGGLEATALKQPLAKDVTGGSAEVIELGDTVVAYYFYGDVRCQTCKKLEAYTSESILTSFTNELSTGALKWETVNTDEKENEHFVTDFELTSRSVVLVKWVDGKQTEWKNLERIWDLVGEKGTFQKYITEEARAFLKTGKQ